MTDSLSEITLKWLRNFKMRSYYRGLHLFKQIQLHATHIKTQHSRHNACTVCRNTVQSLSYAAGPEIDCCSWRNPVPTYKFKLDISSIVQPKKSCTSIN